MGVDARAYGRGAGNICPLAPMIVAGWKAFRTRTVGQPGAHALLRDAAQVSRPYTREEVDADAARGDGLADDALDVFGGVGDGVGHALVPRELVREL